MRALILALLACGLLSSEEALDFSMEAAALEAPRRQGLPPITLVVDAEFIIQRIRIVSDSRQPEVRTDEIRKTLAALVAAAAEARITVRYGKSVVTVDNLADVPIHSWGKRKDVSNAALELKQDLTADVEVGIVDAVVKLIDGIEPTGRAEIQKTGFGIGIDTPEKHRYVLLQKMVTDAKKVQGMIGADYRVQLTGLDKRLKWTRHSLKQLELYYDYSFAVLPPNGE